METQTATASGFAPKQSPQLVGTDSAQNAIARVRYSHDAMIDLLIANPATSQGELAKHFGYTQAWVSRIMNSDAFLARLAQRKSDLVDPSIALTIDEKLRAVAAKSLDIVLEKLSSPVATFEQAMEGATLASKALGYGARQNNLNVQQNFVVAMPGKAATAEEWAKAYTPAGPIAVPPGLAAMVEDVSVKE